MTPGNARAWSTTQDISSSRATINCVNLVDGVIRMSFFLIMIFSFSLLKDLRRVFEYHGAEHKTVFTGKGVWR